jgi:thiol-disulfide isomerase/thioredoxin
MIKRFLTLAGILAAFSLTACDVQKSVTVGSVAPSLTTKTLADVDGDFSRITTYRYPDERMYQYSLDKALAAGKPIVLEFATPGHCTVCDVQLQMLKGIMEKYQNDVLFLHMDQYRNPEAFAAFQVMGDPWTFVIDRNQVVQFKRAGSLLYDELDATLTRVMSVQLRQDDRGRQVG